MYIEKLPVRGVFFLHFLRHLMMLLSAFLKGKKKVRYFVGYLAKRKKPSFYLKLGFFVGAEDGT